MLLNFHYNLLFYLIINMFQINPKALYIPHSLLGTHTPQIYRNRNWHKKGLASQDICVLSPSHMGAPIVATAVEIWIHFICTLLGNFYLLFVLLSFFVLFFFVLFVGNFIYIMLAGLSNIWFLLIGRTKEYQSRTHAWIYAGCGIGTKNK